MEVKCQYALPVYNLDNLNNIPDNELQFTINDQLFLDTLLMELRENPYPIQVIKRNSVMKKKLH